MTQKYECYCWNCGSQDMEALGEYVRCRACGATWNEVPELQATQVIGQTVTMVTRVGEVKVRGFRPSASVQRRAARARNASIKT